MVILARKRLRLKLVHLVTHENVEVMLRASKISLVGGEVLGVDSESPVVGDIDSTICRTA